MVKHRILIDEALGISKKDAPAADLMEMVVIRLGGELDEKNDPEIIKYLYGIFENSKYNKYFEKYVKVRNMDHKNEIKSELKEIRKELGNMTGVALLNYRDGMSDGEAKKLVECVDNAVKNLHLTLEEACECLGTTVSGYEKAKRMIRQMIK